MEKYFKFTDQKTITWFILSLGFWLRLVNLNQSFWLDEGAQAILSSHSLSRIIAERVGDFHPPLYYVLVHYWMFLGRSEVWLRLPSVFFGVLTIWGVYLIVNLLFNKNLAILTALIMAISPFDIYYSQELRMYSALTCFATFSSYFFIKFLKEPKFESFYILFSVLLVYTHYMGIFLLITQTIFMILFKKNKFKLYLKYLVVIFIFFLPWLPEFFNQLISGVNPDSYLPGWGNLLSLSFYKSIPLLITKFLIGRVSLDNRIIYATLIIILCLFTAWAFYKSFSLLKTEPQKYIIFWFVLPTILTLLISFKIPMFEPFRLIFVLPAFYILLCLGITASKFKVILIGFITFFSLAGLFLYYINPHFQREDWRAAANLINNNLSDHTAVWFAWPEPFAPYQWYMGTQRSFGLIKNFPAKMDQIEPALETDQDDNIYYFGYLTRLSDPNDLITDWLVTHNYQLVQTYDFSGVGFIYNYKKRVT